MKRALFLLAALPIPATVSATPVAPHIWPVRGLYGLEHSACGSDTGETSNTAVVAPALCAGLDAGARQIIGQRFVEAMERHFPDVEAIFAASLPANATPRARLAGSLIASLRLSRATIWRIDKQAGTDAFLPITLTLDITNGATGEVVFTRTRSQIAQGSYASGDVDTALAAQFPAKLAATMESLVSDAAAQWQPYSQTASVVGKEGDNWIIDRGRAQGLRTGDSIGEDGQIVYAGGDYAVVHPTLAGYTVGQTLSRATATPAELLARPSVLTVIDSPPEGYASAYLTSIFEDALGAHSGFAPMPVNPGFVNLRSMALGEAQAPSVELRSLPDYVAVVRVALLPSASFASNIPGVSIERHDARAFITLVDRSGRAIFAVQGVGRITDQVSGSTRFSLDQRHDTAIRNALIDAATKFKSFRQQPLELPITEEDGRLRIADAGGALPLQAQLTVLRDAGTARGMTGRVRVPIGQVRTTETVTGGVLAEDADVAAFKLHAGDVVAIDQAGQPLLARSPVVQCLGADGLEVVDNRGSIQPVIWSWAASAGFVGHYRGPVRVAGLAGRLASFAPDFAGWDRFAPAQADHAETCFTPVVAVTPGAATKRGEGVQLTAGYALMQGATKRAGHGVQAMLKPTALPPGVAPEIISAMLQQDLADQLPGLADTAAATFPPL